MAQLPRGHSRSSVQPVPTPADDPQHCATCEERGKDSADTRKAARRRIKIAAGGVSASAVAAVLKTPVIGWLLIGTALAALVIGALLLTVVLIGPDENRTPFERVMSFTGLLLRRTPGRYALTTTRSPQQRKHCECDHGHSVLKEAARPPRSSG